MRTRLDLSIALGFTAILLLIVSQIPSWEHLGLALLAGALLFGGLQGLRLSSYFWRRTMRYGK